MLGAFGGLRIGEMLGFARKAPRPSAWSRQIVTEILVEVSGQLYFGPPKTRAGRRAVPLPRVAIDALDDHLRRYPAAQAISYSVLPRADRFRLASWRRRFWKPAVEASGLSPLRPHDLRHTAVALWIAAGATPREIATRAGHTSVVTVLDRYGHLFPDSEQKVQRRSRRACQGCRHLTERAGRIHPRGVLVALGLFQSACRLPEAVDWHNEETVTDRIRRSPV